MNLTKTSKFIALILRHKPETIGISLDEHGWAGVHELIEGINATGKHHIDMQDLEEIVRMDEKQRYSFNEDKSLIRANQGHSIPVDVELKECTPPAVLYHGTGEKYVTSIDTQGLIHCNGSNTPAFGNIDFFFFKLGSNKSGLFGAAGSQDNNGFVFSDNSEHRMKSSCC